MKKYMTAGMLGLLALAMVSCGMEEQRVSLTYVEWAGEIAATNVAKVALEEMGYEVEIQPVSAAAMWQAVGSGASDGMVSAWLPATHAAYLEGVRDGVEELSPLLNGAKIGLIVPQYVEIDSVADIAANADRFGNRIVGIDPGSGLMQATEQALDIYAMEDIELVEGTDAIMTAVLADEIRQNNWVVVTGWAPHWKFASYELKFLDDPEGVFGGAEYVSAIVRKGLREEHPDVVTFLDNFYWTPEQIGVVMGYIEEGMDPMDAARTWIADNRQVVNNWLP